MSQEQLKPCPFCGGRAEFNEHTPECYFSKLADVKKAPKGDVACMVDLIPAWNTRATQPDHFPESGKMMKPDLSGFDAFDVLKQGRQALAPQPEQAKGGETGGLYEWSVDVHEDEDDGLTWINIRNPNDDVACASVKTYIGRNRRTIASQVLVGFQEAFRSAICVNQDPAPAASVSDEREAFDRWALRTHGKFALDSDDTGAMWDAWQARAILALRPAQAGVPDDIVKDAQRYRWLRAPDRDVSLVLDKVVGYEPIGPAGTGGYNIYEYRAGEELDAAIDAAMLAAAPKEGGAA